MFVKIIILIQHVVKKSITFNQNFCD